MGDYSLMAGSPADAADHYQTSADLARACNDSIWLGAAIEGLAHSKVPSWMKYSPAKTLVFEHRLCIVATLAASCALLAGLLNKACTDFGGSLSCPL